MSAKAKSQTPLVCHGHTRPIVDLQYRYVRGWNAVGAVERLVGGGAAPDRVDGCQDPPTPTPAARSAVTPDGYFLISASKDSAAQLRNGETGDWIGSFLGHKGAVWGAALDDPALLAGTASADFTARVWNAVTGDELHSFEHKHIVRTIDFAHGSSAYRMVTGGEAGVSGGLGC